MKASAVLDDRGFRALIRAAGARRHWTAPRDRFLIYLMGKTGLRISEALALRRRAFWTSAADGSTPFLEVRTLKQRGGKRPIDHVLLSEAAARAARHYLDRQLPAMHRAAGAGDVGPGSWVFPTTKGRQAFRQAMTRRNAAAILRTYLRLAGLPATITLHSLRHFRGTQLLRETGDQEFTRREMRHRDLRNVAIYQHEDPRRRRRYLRALDDAEGV